ncbi:hypothetical protein SAMN04488096_10631 [Mesonia phycicola]|uniref:Uncharacterized protein n=1 Tax=Mesonia phycicola TaxID=579105 RepID=A0A1M6FA86_9FLAO|nr:hypothetical protein [Mesonia phycicola]SHI94664.1 hypothetical protein SAMN04488096_10631 [Mesonia phycicola]
MCSSKLVIRKGIFEIKNLLQRDYIIDDRDKRAVDKFKGRHLHFAEKGKGFEGWKEVLTYMKKVA